MLIERRGRAAALPRSSATALQRRRAPHRSLRRLTVALVAFALLAPAAAASTGSPKVPSLAPTVAGAHAGPIAPRGPVRADLVNPSVTALDPATAPNDITTSVVITGTDFAAVMDDTGAVTSPTAFLGSTALTGLTWESSTTLTARVPWGMDPGVYALTIVNPVGGTGSLAGAFTVTQGIGQWNGGDLFGGDVAQILMKPGDPDTLYASAHQIVGLFRSDDAGEHWAHVSGAVGINNGRFAIDPQHPSWLYGYEAGGLYRSQDEGDTWTKVMPNAWPDGSAIARGQVYVSPHDPGTLFVSSYDEPGSAAGGALGLIVSTDGGVTWRIVAGLEGIGVEDVAFHPTERLQMVLATPDARVFQSMDGGADWQEVARPPLSNLGFGGSITYNPYSPTTEVWIASTIPGQSLQKSTDAFSTWQNVTPVDGISSWRIAFTSGLSVYSGHYRSKDGGRSWRPLDGLSGNSMVFDPEDPLIGYIGHARYGVQKTTDGGLTSETKNHGLAAMHCYSLEASRADPLRVYATFVNWPGIYRSDDGTNTWTFLPIEGAVGVWVVHEDPFDPERLYVSADSGFYLSVDGGESWSDLGWNLPAGSPVGMKNNMAPDPHQQGHLLVGLRTFTGVALLYASSNSGASWQSITMPEELTPIEGIAFDPETPGLVYLTTSGTGVYRSTDFGTTWARIDDRQQPQMEHLNNITIATRPQHVVFAGAVHPCRSKDGGATWECRPPPPGGPSGYMFAAGDSTRLYAATSAGLFFSGDIGDTWTRAAGAFGQLQILAFSNAVADGHTIVYAATSGATGSTAAAVTGASAADVSPKALSTPGARVEAGIYRHVQVPTTRTLTSLGAEDGWILESRHTSNQGGTWSTTATTIRLGDDRAKKQYRAILSFGTGASLPDTAVITKVTLRIRKQGFTGGGSPVTAFRGLMLDIRRGTFGTARLQASDFGAAASRSYGPFKPGPISNWYSIDVTGAKAYINKLASNYGRTQVRLRFRLDDNSNALANYLSLYSGNAPASARPQLIVTYYVP